MFGSFRTQCSLFLTMNNQPGLRRGRQNPWRLGELMQELQGGVRHLSFLCLFWLTKPRLVIRVAFMALQKGHLLLQFELLFPLVCLLWVCHFEQPQGLPSLGDYLSWKVCTGRRIMRQSTPLSAGTWSLDNSIDELIFLAKLSCKFLLSSAWHLMNLYVWNILFQFHFHVV